MNAANANRLSVWVTTGGRTAQTFSVALPDGEYNVVCRVQVGQPPVFQVTPIACPSCWERLVRWVYRGR